MVKEFIMKESEDTNDVSENKINKFLWIIPGLLAFLIALIPTLSNAWPFTVDIYVHARTAEVFSQYGLTFIDPMINPPNGAAITSPPLFSLLLMYLGNFLKVNYFDAARFLQPFLALFVVSSVSYVAKKFYGNIAGLSAGFIIMASYLFTRMMSPLPETFAIIFVPIAIYMFYRAVTTRNYLYTVITSILFLIILATHQSTTSLLFLVLTMITLVLTILKKDNVYLKNYLLFISIIAVCGLIASIGLLMFKPEMASTVLTYAMSMIKTSVPYNDPISNAKYVIYLGIVLIFMLIGGAVALERRTTKDLFIIIWICVLFVMSKSYWFGINVYTIRLLIHLLMPLSILGGLGLSYLYLEFKRKEFPNESIRKGLLIITCIILSLFAVVTATSSNFETIPQYNTQPYGSSSISLPQLAPPTNSDVELETWFNTYGDNKSSILSNNYNTNQFLVATTGQPVINVGTSEHIITDGFKSSELNTYKIGYFVFDKRLTFPSNTSDKYLDQGFIYLNSKYSIQSILPSNATLLYQNQYYMVYKI
jgi:hypothetical protein